jgi:hypothetical protein
MMWWCSDPYLNLLKSFGYSVVRLPKADIRPLQVMAKQGNDLDRLGEISTLLIPGSEPLPQVTQDRQAANISGQHTGDVSFGVGLSILGNVIGAMGGSKLGLDVQYKKANTVVFEFSDVLEDSIEVLKLDAYLAAADVNPLSRFAAELLDADEIYTTTAVLKSKKLSVEATQSNGAKLEVDLPVIQQVVGGNVKVSADMKATSKVTYEGSMPLVFGFQAMQLFYDKGNYTTIRPLEPGAGLKALEKAPPDGRTRFMMGSPFVRLHGD